MTTADLDPKTVASIRANGERVIVDTDAGWRTGVRGRDIFSIGMCFGRMTITEDDQVFHDMIGNRPTYSREEAWAEIARLEGCIEDIHQTLNRL